MRKQEYIKQIKSFSNPTFHRIRHIANESLSQLSKKERNKLYDDLNHGVKILETHEELCQYFYSFGNMHKMFNVFF